VEFGSRRTHEQAAVAAAHAAYLVGFASTSNLEAGRRYGIPTACTSAHAFTLVHASERDAFAAQVSALGTGTTLLVDTFDEEQAIRIAVEVAGPRLGAIRLDSGDLLALAHQARRLLDSLGATGTRIMVTGDLDEHAIAALASAPVDTYGVGTAVVMGAGAPTAGFVYKLVARANRSGEDAPLEPVAKNSHEKATCGGRPVALRRRDGSGTAVAEVVATSTPPPSDEGLGRCWCRWSATARSWPSRPWMTSVTITAAPWPSCQPVPCSCRVAPRRCPRSTSQREQRPRPAPAGAGLRGIPAGYLG
jgi:nicotinate phosphoribosyltransferase